MGLFKKITFFPPDPLTLRLINQPKSDSNSSGNGGGGDGDDGGDGGSRSSGSSNGEFGNGAAMRQPWPTAAEAAADVGRRSSLVPFAEYRCDNNCLDIENILYVF